MDIAYVLSEVLPVEVQDDEALTIAYEGTFASLRTVTIAEGLDLISLTQMIVWDQPLDTDLRKLVVAQAREALLGNVAVVNQSDKRADVVQRYNFPYAGLEPTALQTLVLMVLAAGADIRRAITG